VIEALLADDEIGADDARILAGVDRAAGPAPLPYQKHFNAIEGGWSRLGTAERKRFLRDKFVAPCSPRPEARAARPAQRGARRHEP
jgi:ParB family chromosome partitioning protein